MQNKAVLDAGAALSSTLGLERPLAVLDIESTGIRPEQDRIVELSVLICHPDGSVAERSRRFHPGMPIPPEATRIHGISDQDVANEEPFRRRARALKALLDPCDLAGFNIRAFDLPMLAEEFARAQVAFDATSRQVLDVQQIFHREEPRDLSAAVRFFLGEKLEAAHSSNADAAAALRVLAAQLERYAHLPATVAGLHQYCDEIRPVRTPLGKWFAQDGSDLVFRKGQHRGKSIGDVARTDADYLVWMSERAKDMHPDVRTAARDALKSSGKS